MKHKNKYKNDYEALKLKYRILLDEFKRLAEDRDRREGELKKYKVGYYQALKEED